MFGMHWLDLTVIVAYMFLVAGIGFWSMRNIRGVEDFFMGGRRFGKLFSLFLQFGAGTSSDMPVSVSRESFRNGMSGIWAVMLWLFVTPLYWIISPWYRRLRLLTIGDYFTERFDSRAMGAAYALFSVCYFMCYIAIGLTAVGKTVEVLTPRPESSYTAAEAAEVAEYRRYIGLDRLRMDKGGFDSEEIEQEYRALADRHRLGELRSGYSYISNRVAIPVIALVIMAYCVMGGLTAAVITDLIQGALIIFLSFVIIPFGLIRVGWFSGLHERVPDHMFNLLGSPAASDYTALYVFAIILINLVGIVVQPHIIQTGGGAAKDETSARVGFCYGNYLKRICTVGWALAGVLGFALFAEQVADPDMIWGYMTRQLLAPGLVGLMFAAMLAAIMSSADAFMVSGSALITMNIYRPLCSGRDERHYVTIGRLTAVAIIFGGVLLSQVLNNVIELLKYIWILPVVFGASFWLSYLWRGVTRNAAWCAVVFSLIVSVILPVAIPRVEAIATSKYCLAETRPSSVQVRVGASADDVAAGLAANEGELISKELSVAPVTIFFENKVRLDPAGTGCQERGIGKFRVYLWLFSVLGTDFSSCSRSTLNAIVFICDAVFPFIILLLASLFTAKVNTQVLDRFYARVHTPVLADPDADRLEVEKSYATPHRFDGKLLFPGTGWEMLKPDRTDVWGFILAVVVALLIAGVLFLVSWIRWP
ncbi:MAG: sodium:solute symporter family protein [Gemmatimonadota bacterium]|nr:sodium:solute symporter family protein [Gemmatimonadota bacterium]